MADRRGRVPREAGSIGVCANITADFMEDFDFMKLGNVI